MSNPLVLELSISDATDENKLSENLAHRESKMKRTTSICSTH